MVILSSIGDYHDRRYRPEDRRSKKSAAKSRLSPRSAKKVVTKRVAKRPTARVKAKATETPRLTRSAQLGAMLRRPLGATTAEVAAEMGIEEHSARALISTERRKQGWEATLEKRLYRIVD